MTTRWICGVLCLLSIVAYSRISVALNGAAEPLSEARAWASIAAAPPSRSTAIPAPASVDNDDAATKLSEYVYLHETRNTLSPQLRGAHAHVCAP